MALTFTRTFTQNVTGLTGLITNTTVYGGANQDRNEAAEYLLWAKLDANGAATYYNPSQGNVLTALTYTVATTLSGWFQDIGLRIQFYDPGTGYVKQVTNGQGVVTTYESIVYQDGSVYRCINDVTGTAPDADGGSAYWTLVPFDQLYTLLSNTNIEVSVEDRYVYAGVNQQLSTLFASKKNCGCSLQDLEYILGLRGLKISADSEFANEDYNEGQRIIENIQSQIATC